MSSDETFLRDVMRALDRVGLEALVVGSVAAVLNGAPIMTHENGRGASGHEPLGHWV